MIHFSISKLWHLPPKNREKTGERKEGMEGGTKSKQPSALCLPSVRRGRPDSKGSYLSPEFPLLHTLPSPKAQQAAHDAHSTALSVDEIKLLPSPPRPAPPLLPSLPGLLLLCCPPLPGLLHLCCPASVYGSHSGSKSQRCLWCGVLPGFQI